MSVHSGSVSPSLPNNFSKLYGVRVTEDVLEAFNNIKLKRTHSYAVFKIDENDVEVEKLGDKAKTWKDLVDELPADEPRYAVVDVGQKLVIVNWGPSGVGVKERMTYASTKDAVKKRLQGVSITLNVNDKDELTQKLQDVDKSQRS